MHPSSATIWPSFTGTSMIFPWGIACTFLHLLENRILGVKKCCYHLINFSPNLTCTESMENFWWMLIKNPRSVILFICFFQITCELFCVIHGLLWLRFEAMELMLSVFISLPFLLLPWILIGVPIEVITRKKDLALLRVWVVIAICRLIAFLSLKGIIFWCFLLGPDYSSFCILLVSGKLSFSACFFFSRIDFMISLAGFFCWSLSLIWNLEVLFHTSYQSGGLHSTCNWNNFLLPFGPWPCTLYLLLRRRVLRASFLEISTSLLIFCCQCPLENLETYTFH